MPMYTDYRTALTDAVEHQIFLNSINNRTSLGAVLTEYDYEALASDLYSEGPEVPDCIIEYVQEGFILFQSKQRANHRENLSDAYARNAEEEAREIFGGLVSDLEDAYWD